MAISGARLQPTWEWSGYIIMPKSSVKSVKNGYMLTLTKADKFNHRPKTFDVRLGKQSHKRTIPAYHKAQNSRT